MSKSTIPRSLTSVLLAGALMLPVAIVVLVLVGKLLTAMDDAAGEAVLARLVLAGAIVWIIDLVALVAVLGINSLGPPEE